MAESRILNYDGEYVTYFYDRHEDNIRITEKIHVFDFIKRLISHIPEKHFNMVRYYGIYAIPKSKTKHLKTLKQHTSKSFKWASKLLFYFNSTPLKCNCGNTLRFEFIVTKKHNRFSSYYSSYLT